MLLHKVPARLLNSGIAGPELLGEFMLDALCSAEHQQTDRLGQFRIFINRSVTNDGRQFQVA
jgi:hypothetical protein